MALDTHALRMTMRQWVTGVTIVTSAVKSGAPDSSGVNGMVSGMGGMTVSSFTSVALEPPTVLVCLNKETFTHDLVARSGVYAISMLGADQEALSNRFAGGEPNMAERFAGLELSYADTGSPLLPGALAWLDCVVRESLNTGTHTIYVAEVVYAHVNPDAAPLVYHNRGYRMLTDVIKAQA